ncbi:uncharacterized protein LOC131428707 [Malaya genurostris]|uniref:uncharacterized protein LOC131428707 n=1 Tax=Malaya genurostris TaxID=325434 RepID=UPI0026F3842C|nr:uncharacterized protein LOC131428707 [Malaya genurostris]
MTRFLASMLRSRTFKVLANGTLSNEKLMETGLCQGSVLSVTMFLIAIDTIKQYLPPDVLCLLYADDIVLIASGENAKTVESRLQNALNMAEKWEAESGFKISEAKSATVIFKNTRSCKPGIPNSLQLNGTPIPRENSYRCLGVIFDQCLQFRKHAEEIRANCQQRIQFLRSVATRNWGGDRHTLLKLYRATVLEKLLYAAPVISGMSEVLLRRLETIHNAGLRTIIGAFHTSPIDSLHAESGIPNIQTLLEQRTAIFAARRNAIHNGRIDEPNDNERNLSDDSNPSSDETKDSGELWGTAARIIKEANTAISRGKHVLQKIDLTVPEIVTFTCPNGSKNHDRCGYSVVSEDLKIQKRINGMCSIYSAESLAVMDALSWIVNNPRIGAYLICTDSMSVLTTRKGTEVIVCWVPSHVGITGNETADQNAKQALKSKIIDNKQIDLEEFKAIIKNGILSRWQQCWYQETRNKLREVKNTISPFTEAVGTNRQESVKLARLRIGHTLFTHSYLLDKTETPRCQLCNSILSVKHVIVDCAALTEKREKIGLSPNLREALADDQERAKTVIKYFKDIKLYDQI